MSHVFPPPLWLCAPSGAWGAAPCGVGEWGSHRETVSCVPRAAWGVGCLAVSKIRERRREVGSGAPVLDSTEGLTGYFFLMNERKNSFYTL